MKKLQNNQNGLVGLALIIVAIMVAGYFLITNLVESDQGQEIKEKATEVTEKAGEVIDRFDSEEEN